MALWRPARVRAGYVVPGRWIALVNDTTVFRIAAIEPEGELLWAKPDSTWSWRLIEVDGGTRLVTRLRIFYDWRYPLGALASLVLNEFGDFPMMRRMLISLKKRGERRADLPLGCTRVGVGGEETA